MAACTKTELPIETPKQSAIPSPSVQESVEPSAVETTAEATPDNIPYKIEDFYGRWKIVKYDTYGVSKLNNPEKIVNEYIYIYIYIYMKICQYLTYPEEAK